MKIIIPGKVYKANRRYARHDVQTVVMLFVDSSSREARIEFEEGEYASVYSIKGCFDNAIKSMRKDSLYGTEIRRNGSHRDLYLMRIV